MAFPLISLTEEFNVWNLEPEPKFRARAYLPIFKTGIQKKMYEDMYRNMIFLLMYCNKPENRYFPTVLTNTHAFIR